MELSKMNAKIGEKSKPPIAGINFLIGSRILLETSSTIFHISFSENGATQLLTTPAITK